LPHRNDRTRLAIEDIRRIFEKLLTFPTISDRVTVVWHAGEPLVLGPEYYDAAFSCVRDLCPRDLKIEHSFQTNGILINDAWCDLIENWNVGVGVSIDGPKHIHDSARKTRAGNGTFDKAAAGLRCLQRRSIPFYVISVLTKAALLEPDAMFAFFEEFEIRDVGFNIEEKEGIHTAPTLDATFDDEVVTHFFAQFCKLMKERQFPIAIRELETAFSSIQFMRAEPPLNGQTVPFRIITIDVAGNVYTFSPELAGYSTDEFATFSIGNMFEHKFDDLANSEVLRKMTEQINLGVESCRSGCQYFSVCGGGAPSNKLFENGTFASNETIYCRLTKKRVTDFVLGTIEDRVLSQV
jgi:uncharacterized protein